MSDGRWIRIPLIGDPAGVVLLLPDEALSGANWDHLVACLAAMRPGLVHRDPTDREIDVLRCSLAACETAIAGLTPALADAEARGYQRAVDAAIAQAELIHRRHDRSSAFKNGAAEIIDCLLVARVPTDSERTET